MALIATKLTFRKEKPISKKSVSKHKQRKEDKMAKTKNRIKKLNFQRQERRVELQPLSENDKYIIEMSGYRKGQMHDETLQRITGRSARPQHI